MSLLVRQGCKLNIWLHMQGELIKENPHEFLLFVRGWMLISKCMRVSVCELVVACSERMQDSKVAMAGEGCGVGRGDLCQLALIMCDISMLDHCQKSHNNHTQMPKHT